MILLLACAWVDDGDALARVDADGDGYWSTQFGGFDCDDDDDSIHPGAEEACDGIDNDCRPGNDAEERLWYPDADGDGFGGEPVLTCLVDSTGWALEGGDCDDHRPEVNPGVLELCGDGLDNDCNEREDCIGESEVTLGEAEVRVLGSGEWEQLGTVLAVADELLYASAYVDGEVGLWRFETWTAQARQDGEQVYMGSIYGLYEAELDGEPGVELVLDVPSTWTSLDGTFAGEGYIQAVGDLDGDGLDELVIGDHPDTLIVTRYGVELASFAGSANAASVGDIDGDGHLDLLHATWDEANPTFGGVLLRYDPLNDGPTARWEGDYPYEKLGETTALGDLDGDGFDDVAFSSQQTAFVVLGGGPDVAPLGVHDRADADFIVHGAPYVHVLPDLDGDGDEELLLNTGSCTNSGQTILWRGPYDDILEAPPNRMPCTVAHDTHDVDGDGLLDWVVGDPRDETGGTAAGIVSVLYGP